LELRKSPFLIAILLEITILMSTALSSQNNISAQTYDTITKQRDMFKNNPQIQLGRGAGGVKLADRTLAVDFHQQITMSM
jgi:hypothetical protein